MNLNWKIVAKNINPHAQLREKFREKISKLERQLEHCAPGGADLQIALDRNSRKELFTVGLTLRLGSDRLRAAKTTPDPISAFDQAIKTLLRELKSYKSGMRREAQWKRKGRRKDLHAGKPTRFANVLDGSGAPNRKVGESFRSTIEEEYSRLVYHVRRQIERAEMNATVPDHALDAEAVVDEVVRQAMSTTQDKPEDLGNRLWLYALARQEIERRFQEFRDRAVTNVPLQAKSPPGGLGFGEESNLPDASPDAEIGDEMPDSHILTPDLAAAESDLVDHLQQLSRQWPGEERNVFELHFLEGFEADEIAMLEKIGVNQAQDRIIQVQGRLRQALSDAVQARVMIRPRRLPRAARLDRPVPANTPLPPSEPPSKRGLTKRQNRSN